MDAAPFYGHHRERNGLLTGLLKVVMSLDTFNGLMETAHLLKSSAHVAHLARSIEQYRQGQVKQQDLVDAE